jgi:RNA polymerase sigma-70 factor, ECF subfamily
MQTRGVAAESESALVVKAQNGDLEAFNELVLRYQQLVYNVTLSILGDPDAAEDATQQTFVLAFQHIGAFRGGSFRCWLLRTATHTCCDYLRAIKRRRTVPLFPHDDNGNEIECPLWIADPHPSPEAKLELDEMAQAIYRRLDELPRSYRSVITLIDLNGIDYDEAAHALNIPLGTVKSRLARARLQIRDGLSKEFGFPSGRKVVQAPAWS